MAKKAKAVETVEVAPQEKYCKYRLKPHQNQLNQVGKLKIEFIT